MTCKDCYYYPVCDKMIMHDEFDFYARKCKYFKDKSTVLELPCKLCGYVYELFRFYGEKDFEVIKGRVLGFEYNTKHELTICVLWEEEMPRHIGSKDIGKTVFLTREEAETALKTTEVKNG